VISSIIDGVLLSALAGTSACVLLMYRRLQRFDALQSEAAAAFVRSSQALENARRALEALHKDSGEMAVSLAARLNEARLVMNDIERGASARDAASRQAHGSGHATATQPEAAAESHAAELSGDGDLGEVGERFAGLRTAASAKPQSAGNGERRHAATPPAPAMDAAAAGFGVARPDTEAGDIAASRAQAVTWRALAEAAHRAA